MLKLSEVPIQQCKFSDILVILKDVHDVIDILTTASQLIGFVSEIKYAFKIA